MREGIEGPMEGPWHFCPTRRVYITKFKKWPFWNHAECHKFIGIGVPERSAIQLHIENIVTSSVMSRTELRVKGG
jgi:hypothetical protein